MTLDGNREARMIHAMSAPSALAVLRSLPHFATLPETRLQDLAAGCVVKKLDSGAALFREGEPCRVFFVVISGGAIVFRTAPDGRRQVLHRIKPGMSFAEAAALTMRVFPASAEATEPGTEVLAIDAARVLKEFQRDETLAAAMVSSLCQWLLRLVERVDELSAASAGARLARHLLRLPATGRDSTLRIELPMAKKDLAVHLAITPETLSRLLKRWGDRGIIDNEGKSLLIKDAEALETIAIGTEGD
jgi:CRP/FNR family transcriptional regulator, dissimilatory nitrate respiration regulator